LENDRVQKALNQLKVDHGTEALKNPKSMRGLLNDALGEDARKCVLDVNLLVMALEVWVASDLPLPGSFNPGVNRRVVDRLVGERGISQEHARWAVDCLAETMANEHLPGNQQPKLPRPPKQPLPKDRRWSSTSLRVALLIFAVVGSGIGARQLLAAGQTDDTPRVYEAFALGNGVIVRAGPSTQTERVGSVASGGSMEITCSTRGELVQGMVGDTYIWNKSLDPAGFVSSAYLEIEDQGKGLPECPNMPPYVAPSAGQVPSLEEFPQESPTTTASAGAPGPD
jgi:hypothetical protein